MLDIQMPGEDGFELLRTLEPRPAVVFVTAFDHYAVRAFEENAVDYLLKPFSRERLEQALAHARSLAGAPAPITPLLLDAAQRHGPLERVLIRDGARVHVVPSSSIDYIEAQDDYVAIHAGGKSYLKNQPLSELEGQLDPMAFVRVHRSWLVNVVAIRRLEQASKDSYCAVLDGDKRIPVSRSGYQKVRDLVR
jgi:two-component system LytT family response regulator